MRLCVLVLVFFLSGCATTAPTDSYRPRGSNDDAWAISGQFNEMTGKLLITIDGNTVIDGNVSVWDGAGELSGEYRGKTVSASCNYITKMMSSYEQCTVFVDSERAATLQF